MFLVFDNIYMIIFKYIRIYIYICSCTTSNCFLLRFFCLFNTPFVSPRKTSDSLESTLTFRRRRPTQIRQKMREESEGNGNASKLSGRNLRNKNLNRTKQRVHKKQLLQGTRMSFFFLQHSSLRFFWGAHIHT